MLRFTLRRVAEAALTLAILVAGAFFALRAAPGGPAYVLLGPDRLTGESEARVNRQLGLDRPLPEQLVRWVGTLAHGELGYTPIFIVGRRRR